MSASRPACGGCCGQGRVPTGTGSPAGSTCYRLFAAPCLAGTSRRFPGRPGLSRRSPRARAARCHRTLCLGAGAAREGRLSIRKGGRPPKNLPELIVAASIAPITRFCTRRLSLFETLPKIPIIKSWISLSGSTRPPTSGTHRSTPWCCSSGYVLLNWAPKNARCGSPMTIASNARSGLARAASSRLASGRRCQAGSSKCRRRRTPVSPDHDPRSGPRQHAAANPDSSPGPGGLQSRRVRRTRS